jgi:hypothetical protein
MEGKRDNAGGDVKLSEAQAKARRARNIAIGAVLVLFVAVLYWGTLAKLGANILGRPL